MQLFKKKSDATTDLAEAVRHWPPVLSLWPPAAPSPLRHCQLRAAPCGTGAVVPGLAWCSRAGARGQGRSGSALAAPAGWMARPCCLPAGWRPEPDQSDAGCLVAWIWGPGALAAGRRQGRTGGG